MKTKLTASILVFVVAGAVARLSSPFQGWDRLERDSACIVIVDPQDPVPPTPGIESVNGPRYDFKVIVLSTIKGTNNVPVSRLQTNHELRHGQGYLVFASCHDGVFDAYEEYKVVPLGVSYTPDMIAGKPLAEQIQILLKLSAASLDGEIAKKQEEKKRIESGIKK